MDFTIDESTTAKCNMSEEYEKRREHFYRHHIGGLKQQEMVQFQDNSFFTGEECYCFPTPLWPLGCNGLTFLTKDIQRGKSTILSDTIHRPQNKVIAQTFLQT